MNGLGFIIILATIITIYSMVIKYIEYKNSIERHKQEMKRLENLRVFYENMYKMTKTN